MAGGLQAHPPRCSDLVWGAAGMAAAVLVLGVLAAAAKTLPVVGQWHQQVRVIMISVAVVATAAAAARRSNAGKQCSLSKLHLQALWTR